MSSSCRYIISSGYIFYFILFCCCAAENKYSEDANKLPAVEPLGPGGYVNFQTLQKPFRMAKLNVLWSKAQLRLSEVKLKSLYSELKIHDKEEIMLKKLKIEGHDKNGLKEADMRSKLTGIMSTYGLLQHFEEITDPNQLKAHRFEPNPAMKHINKSLFEDLRLNHLWAKAELAGFTPEELQALKEEFTHHQEKVNQYHQILNKANDRDDDHENSIAEDLEEFNKLTEEEKKFEMKTKKLRELHRDVKDGYDRLYRITAKGPNSQDFIEPQVQGLWKLALNANFTDDELHSLKSEMLHYENRLLKLRHLHAEAAFNSNRDAEKKKVTKQLSEGMKMMEDNIKKSTRKVEKLRLDLETRIMQKHIEL